MLSRSGGTGQAFATASPHVAAAARKASGTLSSIASRGPACPPWSARIPGLRPSTPCAPSPPAVADPPIHRRRAVHLSKLLMPTRDVGRRALPSIAASARKAFPAHAGRMCARHIFSACARRGSGPCYGITVPQVCAPTEPNSSSSSFGPGGAWSRSSIAGQAVTSCGHGPAIRKRRAAHKVVLTSLRKRFLYTIRSRLRARACALWRALTGTYGALRRHGYEGRVYAREYTRRALYSPASLSGCMRESIRCMRDRIPHVCARAYRYQRPEGGQAERT